MSWSFDPSNGSLSLVIKTTRKLDIIPLRRYPHKKLEDQHKESVSPPLSLYVEGGTNCAHIKLTGFDNTKLGFKPRFNETDTICNSASDTELTIEVAW